ncbi:MAG: Uncharacterised protein [Flavobacteriaceae bacterium]|nr:MAG: Uncharacterised protein [Flavobacteriaceae bacterium]
MFNFKYLICLFFLVLSSCQIRSKKTEVTDEEHTSPDFIEFGYSTDSRLNEISGIVESINYPKTFWVHNDSGDQPRIFRVNQDLEIIQEVQLEGISHVDWEDIAYGNYKGQKTLFIGDIGDNKGIRDNIQVYLFMEPQKGVVTSEPLRTIDLSYPDGPRDAEALLFDQRYNELIIISKRDQKSRVYTYNMNSTDLGSLKFEGELNLEKLHEIDPTSRYRITGADAIPERGIIIKNYLEVYLYTLSDSERLTNALIRKSPKKIKYVPELQGEAISLEVNYKGYWVTSECADDGASHQAQPLYFYPFSN